MSHFHPVARLAELPDRSIRRVLVEGRPVLLARLGDTVHAVSDTCSHEDVSLSFGCLSHKDGVDAIKCGYHGARFCLTTGRPLCEPATDPIPVYSVRIDGDAILVALEKPL